MKEDGWAFDVELLLIASLKGVSVLICRSMGLSVAIKDSSVERWFTNGASSLENETTVKPKQFEESNLPSLSMISIIVRREPMWKFFQSLFSGFPNQIQKSL